MESSGSSTTRVVVPIDFAVQSGLHKLSEEQKKRAIYVTGISKNASIKNLSDFFSFCGDLERIIAQHTDSTTIDQHAAVVIFDDPGAASTAVLLAGAVVVDQPVEIFPFALDELEFARRGISLSPTTSSDSPAPSSSLESGHAPGASDPSTVIPPSYSGPQSVPQPRNKNAVSVIASLIAAGYVKGEVLITEMKKKAKDLDASAHVTDTASQAYNATTKKMHDIDEDIHLTERVTRIRNTITTSTTEGVKSLNDKYELKSKADAVKDKAKELSNRAYEYPAIKSSVDYLATGWNSVVGAWNNFRSETTSEISKQRGAVSPSPEEAASEPAAADSPNPSIVPTVDGAPDELDASSSTSSSAHNEPSAPSAASGSSREVTLDFQDGKEPPQVLYPDV